MSPEKTHAAWYCGMQRRQNRKSHGHVIGGFHNSILIDSLLMAQSTFQSCKAK